MARAVRWLLRMGMCAAVVSLVPWLHAQPESADDASTPLPAAVEPSPLVKEPETPEEIFDAVVLLVELARFDLAKIYLQQFVDGQPADELLQRLRDKHGTAEFLRFSKIPELKGIAQPLLDRLNEVSRMQAADPAFVDGLIANLSGTATERELAIRELRNAGVRAVPQMLRRLATAKIVNDRDMVVLALARMGQPSVPALIAALDSPNDPVRLGCIKALSDLEAQAAVPRLWSLAFADGVDPGTRDAARRAIAKIRFGNEDRTDQLSDVLAVQELQKRAEQFLTREAAIVPDEGTSVPLWSWSEAEQTLIVDEVTPEVATLREALRSAQDAFSLGIDRSDLQTTYLTALLANEVQQAGWDQLLTAETSPAMQTAVSTGTEPLVRVLESSLTSGRTDSAWAALQGLNALASPELVRGQPGRPSPVVGALNYPDPRVQFAAATVVLRSESRGDFSGSTRVTEVLRRALTDPGQARAIVMDSDQEEGSLLANFVFDEGFDPIVTRTGREGFLKAAELSGVSLLVIQANISNWALTQTIANLRADSRTAFLPIVIYGPEEVRTKTARLVSRTPNAVFVAEAPASQSFWLDVRPFLSQRRTPPISAQQRDDFKSLAAYWLASIATGASSQTFDIASAEAELLPLVQDDALAPNALVALGRIGTATVQQQLGGFTLNERLSLDTRRGSAGHLAAHIQRFGLLISADEVAVLTNAWQRETNPELKAALAAVVGCFKPNAGLVGERLRRLSFTPIPQ